MQEANLNFLKGATLLTHIDGRPVTTEAILAAITSVNDLAERTLGHLANCETLTAKDPAQTHPGVRTYNESEHLSLSCPGLVYSALTLQGPDVEVLSPEDVDHVIDVCASALDVEAPPVTTPSAKKATRAICDGNGFSRARAILLARL